jgi:hypothetical protein
VQRAAPLGLDPRSPAAQASGMTKVAPEFLDSVAIGV